MNEMKSKFQKLMGEAKRFADQQSQDVSEKIHADLTKVRDFVRREKKELMKLKTLRKQIPAEIKKLKKFVDQQRKEFEKIVKKSATRGSAKKTKNTAKKASKKSSSAKVSTRAPRAASRKSTPANPSL